MATPTGLTTQLQLAPPTNLSLAFSPSPIKISSSVLKHVFEPTPTSGTGPSPSSASSSSSTAAARLQEFELSDLDTPEREGRVLPRLEPEVAALHSPVRLVLPAPPLDPSPSHSHSHTLSLAAAGGVVAHQHGARGGTEEREVSPRELSLTPEPPVQEGEEEGLTASGGLFQYSGTSSEGGNTIITWQEKSTESKGSHQSGAMPDDDEGGVVVEEVCPLGVELSEAIEGAASPNDIWEEFEGGGDPTERAQKEESASTPVVERSAKKRVPIFSPTPSEELQSQQEEESPSNEPTECESDGTVDRDTNISTSTVESGGMAMMNGDYVVKPPLESGGGYEHAQKMTTPSTLVNGFHVTEQEATCTRDSTEHAQHVADSTEHAQSVACGTDASASMRTGETYLTSESLEVEVLTAPEAGQNQDSLDSTHRTQHDRY